MDRTVSKAKLVSKKERAKKIVKKVFGKIFLEHKSKLRVYGRTRKGKIVKTSLCYDREVGSPGEILYRLPLVRHLAYQR